MALVSSGDWLAIIRRWNNNFGSTWIFSPSTLTDDLALNATGFPVMEFKMLCPTSLAFFTLTELSAWTPVMMFIRSVRVMKGFLSAIARSSVQVSFMSRACLDYVISLVCSLHDTIHLCTRWHRDQPNHSLYFQSFHLLSRNHHLSLGFSLISALWQDPMIVLPTRGCFFEQHEILLQIFCIHLGDQSQDCSWIAS